MNEQIHALVRQAYETVEGQPTHPLQERARKRLLDSLDPVFELFAQCIVKECANMVDEDGDAVLALKMLAHFGVK